MIIKRFFDFILAVVGVAILLPFICIVGVCIKITSPGPVFYRGIRAGLNGKPFKIFKFRTMVSNAEQIGSGTTALGDPRITRIGSFLRRYKLDEIPQLFNIILGQMSFVGPRPQIVEYTDRYTAEERAILSVLPGITDFSSIEFSSLDEWVGATNPGEVYDRVVFPRQNELRLKYVRERSFWLDLYLILKTVWMIARRVFSAVLNKIYHVGRLTGCDGASTTRHV